MYRSIFEGARGRLPTCPVCDQQRGVYVAMDWIPAIGRMDAGSGSTFTAFDTWVPQPDGTQRQTRVSSLHQLRAIERDSEQRARDGEGQQMVWRDYSQDRSNGDVHAFRPTTPGEDAAKEIESARKALGSRGAVSILQSSDGQLGPGVTEDSASPFR